MTLEIMISALLFVCAVFLLNYFFGKTQGDVLSHYIVKDYRLEDIFPKSSIKNFIVPILLIPGLYSILSDIPDIKDRLLKDPETIINDYIKNNTGFDRLTYGVSPERLRMIVLNFLAYGSV